MAGVITHMVIAREIIKLLPEGTICNPGLFYLGNLAPDAIHAREGYIREYKKHTHFRDNIPDQDFEVEEHQTAYRKRVVDFITENKFREDDMIDLYRGYVTHILSDERFILTIRKEFCEVMNERGIAQNDPRFFRYIVTDMNRNDLLLVERYEEMDEIRQQLEKVIVQPVDEYLSYQEMKISMDWLLRRHFHEENELVLPRYISYERMTSYIKEAASYVVKLLSQKDSKVQMW
ncbi:MAG: hypothetical protein H6Q59_1699 [Firmicutes bacterium]|nr:hypothetical protein [Bacillota bacterium]